MAKGINPLAYRLGFVRSWDSLFSEPLYIKNYNYFLKSQLINVYIDGFFKKWTWDGRRSYFLNFIYSHVEISWSYSYININVFLYNTGSELIFFRLLRELRNLNHSFSNRYNNNIKNNRNILFLYSLLYENYSKFSTSDSKGLQKELVNYYKGHGSIKKKMVNYKNSFRGEKIKSYLRKFINKSTRYSKGFFNKKMGIIKSGSIFLRKRHKNTSFLNVIVLYVMLRKLLHYKLYKTFISLMNFYFFINPLKQIFKRYFYKDFFLLLGLKKLSIFDKNINIDFIKLNANSLTASAYTKHIWLKLYKKYSFGRVVQGVIRTVKFGKYFKGIMVDCNGRFTKKQKAWHKVFRYGKMPLSKQSALLDSSIIFVKLRYGVASVKININYV